jgi:hypothetical protein
MLRVDLPAMSAEEVYDACCQGIRSQGDLRERLVDASDNVGDRSNAYMYAGALGNLSNLRSADFQVPEVSKSEMEWVYNKRLAAKGTTPRKYYDRLKEGARDGLCSLCGFREAGTLDHYLVKADFPALAVNPLNLLPACWPCNTGKGASSLETVHTYFDDIGSDIWLVAEIVESTPCVIDYLLDHPSSWDDGLKARASNHFALFDLSASYSKQAARQLSGIALSLRLTHDDLGSAGVRRVLARDRDSWTAVDANSWQSAFYRAATDSTWFCDGGFAP